MEYYQAFNSIPIYPHHIKQNVCGSRAKYRDGKKDTAVKVMTYAFLINYLLNIYRVIVPVTDIPLCF